MADLTFTQKNALQLLTDTFAAYGLGTDAFVQAVKQAIIDNTDKNGNIAQATAAYQIRQTDAYKMRFAGNEQRRQKIQQQMAAGMTPTMGELSEASYIALEDSYKAELRKQNVPPQFYENSSYLARMIGNDLSTAEVSARASLARQAAMQANAEVKQQLQSLYGVQEDQIAGFFLDPELGKATIGAVAAGNAAIISASAKRAGLELTRAQAESIATTQAPDMQTALDTSALFATTARLGGLAQESVTGEQSTVTAQDVIMAATGAQEQQAALEKERQRRLASTQAASGMATTEKGVVGLQRANRQAIINVHLRWEVRFFQAGRTSLFFLLGF